MSRLFYHLNPETLTLETTVVDAKRGRVLLAESPFFPGGGGQLPDHGTLRCNAGEIVVTGFESFGG
jgi:misacylated tRNA(Ala) deacylase